MTVSSDSSRVEYSTNGTTGPFSVTFQFLDDTHLAVTYTDSLDVEYQLTLNVDFTLTGSLLYTTTSYPVGGTLTIQRDIPLTQELDLRDGDAFPAAPIEEAFDKLTMIAQQVLGGVNRALRVPEIGSTIPEIPAIASRALKLLGFDAGGNPITVTPTDQSAAALSLLLASSTLSTEGAGMVGYDGSLTYPIGTVGLALARLKTPYDFGAVGNGVADDSNAVEAAIEDGAPIDWCNGTFLVTREIEPTLTGPIRWRSRGATIKVSGSASPIRSVLRLIVGAYSHRIDGELNIDANLKAYIGAFINNEGTTYPTDFSDFYADGLRVANVYRSGTTHSGGDAIWLRGAWRNITLVRPVVENCRMATGAGTAGSQGIFGITFSGNGTQDPRSMTVVDPYVASVLSEDGTYTNDQDGLRAIMSPGSAPSESRLTVIGGTFRNCYGRSIKSQAEHTSVKGSTFIRTQGFTRGYGNEEIDCQEGGGTIENIECIYNGSAPDEIVLFSTTRQASKVSVPFSSIRGLKAVVHSGTTLNRVWRNAIPIASITSQIVKVADVEVTGSGTLTNVCYFAAANSGTGFHLLMSDVVAGPASEWVVCTSGTGSGTLKASRVVHTGGSAANFKSSTSGNFRPFTSVTDAINFNEANSANNTTTPVGVLQRIDAIAPNGASAGGLVRFENFQLADGASQTLTPAAGSLASSVVLISVAASRATHAIASFDSTNGASIVAQPSTSFVAGTTSDPGSGSYRVWYSSGPVISNNSGSTRSFTCVYIG